MRRRSAAVIAGAGGLVLLLAYTAKAGETAGGTTPGTATPTRVLQRRFLAMLRTAQDLAGSARGARPFEDRNLVRDVQRAWGLVVDGKTGPGTLLEAARRGPDRRLPLVMYWPHGSKQNDVRVYRGKLRVMARKLPDYAAELTASAEAERGQGGVAGGAIK